MYVSESDSSSATREERGPRRHHHDHGSGESEAGRGDVQSRDVESEWDGQQDARFAARAEQPVGLDQCCHDPIPKGDFLQSINKANPGNVNVSGSPKRLK